MISQIISNIRHQVPFRHRMVHESKFAGEESVYSWPGTVFCDVVSVAIDFAGVAVPSTAIHFVLVDVAEVVACLKPAGKSVSELFQKLADELVRLVPSIASKSCRRTNKPSETPTLLQELQGTER